MNPYRTSAYNPGTVERPSRWYQRRMPAWLGALIILLVASGVQAQTKALRINGVAFGPNDTAIYATTTGAKADNATDSSAAIAAAVAALPSAGGTIYFPSSANAYLFNVTIAAKSSVRFVCLGARRTTVIKPFTNAPIFTLDSTSGSMQGVTIEDCSFNAGSSTSPAIQIQGTNVNDWHAFHRLFFTGFTNTINITGRTIWSRFVDVEITNDLARGFVVNTSAAVNDLLLESVRVGNSASDGIYLNATGGTVFLDVMLKGCNSEANTGNGVVANNVDALSITGSYIENNGAAATAILIGGTWARGHAVEYNIIQGQGHGYQNTATITSGRVQANYFNDTTDNIVLTTTDANSHVVFGVNYENAVARNVTIDVNGNSHYSSIGPLAVDINSEAVAPTTVTNKNILRMTNAGAVTINNLTGGDPGQIVSLWQAGAGTTTLTNAAGGAGQLLLTGGANLVLNLNQSIELFYDGAAWRQFGSSASSVGNFKAAGSILGLLASGTGTIGDANMTTINFAPSATTRWQMDSSANLLPISDVSGALGGTSNHVANVWPARVDVKPQAIAAATSLTITLVQGASIFIALNHLTAITSLTISAGNDGEWATVCTLQDSTGGAALIPATWTNVRFSGTFTPTATANKMDCVDLVYKTSVTSWVQRAPWVQAM